MRKWQDLGQVRSSRFFESDFYVILLILRSARIVAPVVLVERLYNTTDHDDLK